MLGCFWDLGLINLVALFYGAPLWLHGVHGCFLSSCVSFKVLGRRRLAMMEADGAELMKEDKRRQRTVGSRIGRNDWRFGEASEGSQRNSGSFWCGSRGGDLSFCAG
jgi:hypothetical protein